MLQVMDLISDIISEAATLLQCIQVWKRFAILDLECKRANDDSFVELHCIECFRSCYLDRWFCKFGYISVSTIDLLGPRQHCGIESQWIVQLPLRDSCSWFYDML